MFIDFLTLMMINLVAGTALLAHFIWKGLGQEDQRAYAVGFGMVGLIALFTGFRMAFTWPLPGSYNIAFGESTVLFGIVFLGAAISLALDWDLMPVAIYAFFAGLEALLVGVRIISLSLTKEPLASGLGFIIAGVGGLAAAPLLRFLKDNKLIRFLAIAGLLLGTAFWAFTFYNSLWGHLESFSSWVPATMGQ